MCILSRYHGDASGEIRAMQITAALKELAAIDKLHRGKLMNYGILIETLNGKFFFSSHMLPPPIEQARREIIGCRRLG